MDEQHNRAEYEKRVAFVRQCEADGVPAPAGTYATLMILAKRLGDEPAAEVWAEEMRVAVDKATMRSFHQRYGGAR